MSTAIQGVTQTLPIEAPTSVAKAEKSAGDFGNILGDAFKQAGAAERTADEAERKFAAGDPDIGIHEVMITAEKAQIAVKFAVTMKNKVLEAYKELMNTQI